jgi:hypothetical protein
MVKAKKPEKRYKFFLNPYEDSRFTSCPQCNAKTRQRKLPLAIFIEPSYFFVLNKTCRYCPGCDLLIAHQNDLEDLLLAMSEERAPHAIGNTYHVVGTVDRADWRVGVKSPDGTIERSFTEILHEFKRELSFTVTWQ